MRNDSTRVFALAGYAAQHWVDHPQFGKVSPRILDGMDNQLDLSKPHFAAWLRIYDIMGQHPTDFFPGLLRSTGSPLFYAWICGHYDPVERLIAEHSDRVRVFGGYILAPFPAALRRKYFRVAKLLH